MKNLLTTIILLFTLTPLYAQQYSGIIAGENGERLKYANIGIVDGNYGTISDLDGLFFLNLPDESNNLYLRFSKIGYQTKDMTVKEFKELKSGIVYLENIKQVANNIPLKTEGLKVKSVVGRGARIPGGVFSLGYFSNAGSEIGNVVHRKEEFIPKSAEFIILSCHVDTVLFRVNIYEIEGSYVGDRINTREIYLNVFRDDNRRVYEVDLSDQNLLLQGYYYIALEFLYSTELDEDSKNGVIMYFPTRTGESFVRENSHGHFIDYPLNFGMKIEAWIVK